MIQRRDGGEEDKQNKINSHFGNVLGAWQIISNRFSVVYTFLNFIELAEISGLGIMILSFVLSPLIPIFFIIGGLGLYLKKEWSLFILKWCLIPNLIITIFGILILWFNYFTLPEFPKEYLQNLHQDGFQTVDTFSRQYYDYLELVVYSFLLYVITCQKLKRFIKKETG